MACAPNTQFGTRALVVVVLLTQNAAVEIQTAPWSYIEAVVFLDGELREARGRVGAESREEVRLSWIW